MYYTLYRKQVHDTYINEKDHPQLLSSTSTPHSQCITMNKFHALIFLQLTFSIHSTNTQQCTGPSVTEFTDETVPESFVFNHLAVHKHHGWVYVGGVNWIYQLTPDLQLVTKYQTGPLTDTADSKSHKRKKPVNVINRILVQDYLQSALLSCGNTSGLCTVHMLKNISYALLTKHSLVDGSINATLVAFVAPGPAQSDVLYVASSASFTGPAIQYESSKLSITTRSLGVSNLFQVLASNANSSINKYATGQNSINYVYGFSSGSYSYFLANQMNSSSPGARSPPVAKIVRICQEDQSNYISYAELPLECKGGNLKKSFSLLQAAYVAQSSHEFALSFGITTNDDVLFATFAEAGGAKDKLPKPTGASALCVYALSTIDRWFAKNIRGAKLTEDGKCTCGVHSNTSVTGTPLVATALHVYNNTRLTAVASTIVANRTVIFLGTGKGYLKALYVKNHSSALEFNNIGKPTGLGLKSAINTDMLFSPGGNYLYVMADRKVVRIEVKQCSSYKTCNKCLGARQHFCGWCPQLNICSFKSTCWTEWISYEIGRCAQKPVWIPSSQVLQLRILNLPPSKFECRFSFGDKVVIASAYENGFGVNCSTPYWSVTTSSDFTNHHQIISRLSVVDVDNRADELLAVNVTFYNCYGYGSCRDCVLSPFPCHWCAESYQCVHNETESTTKPASADTLLHQPLINATSDIRSPEILVPISTSRTRTTVQVTCEDKTRICTVRIGRSRDCEVLANHLKGSVNNGTNMLVFGKHLLAIQKPCFVTSTANREKIERTRSVCTVYTDELMVCPLSQFPGVETGDERLKLWNYAFVDEVTDVEIPMEEANHLQFIFYPYLRFEEVNISTNCASGEAFYSLGGWNVNSVYERQEDFVVKIGDDYCNVTAVLRNALVCKLSVKPLKEPVDINVYVGGELDFYIGKFVCEKEQDKGAVAATATVTITGPFQLCGVIFLVLLI